MKKLVSVLLVLCMLISALPCFASDADVEKALIAVKSKIDIPEKLTKFEHSQYTYDDSVRYDFTWHDEEYLSQIHISCDMAGNVVSYSSYENGDYTSSRKLISYTITDGQILAEAFVKKVYPEYFENETNTLKLNAEYTNSSYSGRFKTFTFRFDRFYNGEKVESNYVLLRVRATNDKLYIQSMSAALDENARFETDNAKDIGAIEYVGKFPLKMYYATDYTSGEEVVSIFYSIEKGFVSRIDGEVLTQEYFDSYEETGDVMFENSVSMGSANKNMLTDAEIKALEEVASLVKVEEVEKRVRALDILGVTPDMTVVSTSINKYNETYTVRFVLEGEERRTSVTYNGETGFITNIYTYKTKHEDKDVNERTAENTALVPEEGIKEAAQVLSGNKLNETEVVFNNNSMTATRIVNGIPFPENSIRATYNLDEKIVTSYSISWMDDVSHFPVIEDAIGIIEATDIVFEIKPVYNTLVKTEKAYIPAIAIDSSVTINAITGKNTYASNEKLQYTDIDSHWAKDMINILWEHDIYLEGDRFNPDDAITQADMILLFSACRDSGIIPLGWTKERIAEYGCVNGYVEAEEPDKLMTRLEAFKVMIEILGFGSIADFDIYKSSYSDLEANGSAEILKAMGVLVGDTARGDDYLTRAEAAVMVYRYLAK